MKRILITTLLLVGIWSGSLTAATIYVDASAKGAGKGTSNMPYSKIQKGISMAKNGDTVLVRPGTYREAIDFLGKAITVTSSAGRDTTIIDGAGLGQVSVVTFKTNEQTNSILQGFTVRNGQGSYQMVTGSQLLLGGAIVCVSTSPTLSNLKLTSNSAAYGGGVCGVYTANPVMSNVLFENNNVTVNGGGATFMENCAPSFLTCQFNGNTAQHTGGGINVRKSNPNISNCDFTGNNGGLMGGGIRVGALSSATIDNSRFTSNNTAQFGGGVSAGSDTAGTPGTVTITNSNISGNSSPNGNELAIYGIYPAFIDISYSIVNGGYDGVYVDDTRPPENYPIIPPATTVKDSYLHWGDGMSVASASLQSNWPQRPIVNNPPTNYYYRASQNNWQR